MKMRKKQTGRRIMAVLLSFLLLIGVMPVTVTPVRAEDATQSEVNADAGTDVDADANADADADADVMPLADIVSGIVVVPLDITYDGAVHDAVEVQGMNADTDHVTYKLGDGDWAEGCPQISEAGEYTVTVKVERDGYTPYESGAVTARIAKKQIENVEVTPYSGTYDETAHDVVAISEEGADYTISFKEENGDWTDVCPQIENVGTKTVTVKMERDNYETLTNDYTAEVLSGTIEGVSATLKTELVYTGTPQQLVESVTGTRAGDKIYYKIDDGAWIVNTDATAGMVTDAGTYKVSIKVERGSNYEAKEIELDPATVTVKKAPQTITFVKDNLTQVVFDETEPANNVYDYSAEGEPGNTRSITYRVENNAVSDTTDIAAVATIDQSTGELKILKGGYHIKVIATIAGDTNYESTEIAKSITVKNCENDLLSFKDAVVNASLKDGAVLTGQKADKKYTDDNGEITYAALIDGNAETLDAETRTKICTDIFDDAQWLIGLVENLLSITRIEDGRMNLQISPQLMDEVVEETLRHISRKSKEHIITTTYSDEILLADMDARLIMQVIINLVDNAIKYTQKGSRINISAYAKNSNIVVDVSDDGPGIPEQNKAQVFEMFFTGQNQIADSHRSLGLGLTLCRTILAAHKGTLTLRDNEPHGCIFSFELPKSEVSIHE